MTTGHRSTKVTDDDCSDGVCVVQEAARKKKEKVEQEIAEYEEMRREQREKEADDLDQLRQKRVSNTTPPR